jgi:large repetitive protein
MDDVASATTDDFEAFDTNWTVAYGPHSQSSPGPQTGSFFRAGLDNNTNGWAAFNNIESDESLISPQIKVGGTGDFTISFSHLQAIFPGGIPYLGGVVVEITADEGTHWVDITDPSLNATITNGYEHAVADRTGVVPQYQSPLAGRMAFTAADTSALAPTPTFKTTTVNFHGGLGTATVRVRFRYGGGFDDFNTQFLFELDDFAVTGATNTPFLKDTNDRHLCVPIVDAGADQTVNEAATATLHGTATDLTSGTVTTAWTQVDGPPVTLTGATTLTPTFTAPMVDQDTVLTFRLTATGTNGARTADTHVTVHDLGHPPTARITGPSSAQTKQAVSLDGSGSSDPDSGQTLTYAWSQDSGPAGTFSAATSSHTTFTAPATAGTVVVSLTVTDSTGLTAKTTQNIVVSNPPENSGCTSTGAPSSMFALLIVAAFMLLHRRRQA